MSIADLRRDYPGVPLVEAEAGDDPIALFTRWFDAIRDIEGDPNAMALATTSADGRPSVRTVLLKGVDNGGFVFFTNYDSRKARDLSENPRASLLFFWRSVARQVRIDGTVSKVSGPKSALRPASSRSSRALLTCWPVCCGRPKF